MEIERKFLVKEIVPDLDSFKKKEMVQGYLSTHPVVRVRKEDDEYFLTYKGEGLLKREEYNLPLTKESFYHLIKKADGIVIEKDRFFIPINDNGKKYTAELDIFKKDLSPLVMVEVEFETEEDAKAFRPPSWFGEEKTYDESYHNSTLSREGLINLSSSPS